MQDVWWYKRKHEISWSPGGQPQDERLARMGPLLSAGMSEDI